MTELTSALDALDALASVSAVRTTSGLVKPRFFLGVNDALYHALMALGATQHTHLFEAYAIDTAELDLPACQIAIQCLSRPLAEHELTKARS